jgi:DNA-binding CsgD family transcriptional regulator
MPYVENEDGTRRTNPTTELQRLRDVHHNIIRMSATGLQPKQIASLLDITPQTVYNTLGTELAKAELARLRQEADEAFLNVQERLQVVSPAMLDILVEAAVDPEESTKLRTDIADKLLNKAGHQPVQKTITANAGKVDTDFLLEVKRRAAEIREARNKQLYEGAQPLNLEKAEVVDAAEVSRK